MVLGLSLGFEVCLAQDQRFDGNRIMRSTIRPGSKAYWAWDHSPYITITTMYNTFADKFFIKFNCTVQDGYI